MYLESPRREPDPVMSHSAQHESVREKIFRTSSPLHGSFQVAGVQRSI
jgi:hypothetical protein